MKNYIYQNTLIGKKQLRKLLAWSFTNYDSMQACKLADELKYLGFKYASQAGISINIEDLKVPFAKNLMLETANQDIVNTEKLYLKGKITETERFQKIINTWSLTSESLKSQIIYYFKNYDPLNSVYIMAFSGARGNLSQVRQLVGMRGLMADPSGQIMNLPIKKNFREGLTITDYLMSGYGARKGIVDTALKTANSGYLTRRLIDVGHDIFIREKDCRTDHSFLFQITNSDFQSSESIYQKLLGRVINKSIVNPKTNAIIIQKDNQITPNIIEKFRESKITDYYVRSPLTCQLYRAVCQKCYGWDLANENLVDIGEAIGILAGQSIGEPGTQLTMRTFHTGGVFTSEARQQIISPTNGIIKFHKALKTVLIRTNRGENVLITKNSGLMFLIPDKKTEPFISLKIARNTIVFPKNNQYILKNSTIGELLNTKKEVRTEIKPILSDICGEILMPSLQNETDLDDKNKLLWILSGQLYNSPKKSYINFYPDHKLNCYSYVFRTKCISHYNGKIKVVNNQFNLYQRLLEVTSKVYSLKNSQIHKLKNPIQQKNYLLKINNFSYILKICVKNKNPFLQLPTHNEPALHLTKLFRTLTGGHLFYDRGHSLSNDQFKSCISYRIQHLKTASPESLVDYRTLLWLPEETHQVNCEPTALFVEEGDVIPEGFELIPDLFSKSSGIVTIHQKLNVIENISIKCGSVYEIKKTKNFNKKLYYSGEVLFSSIYIKSPTLCEQIPGKKKDQLLIRPIDLYEVATQVYNPVSNNRIINQNLSLKVQSKVCRFCKSDKIIKSNKNVDLLINHLYFKLSQSLNKNTNIEIFNKPSLNLINFQTNERLTFNNFVAAQLRYKNIQSCLLVQPTQFVDQYTILGYLESLTKHYVEIVKFKIKSKNIKQILLISNDDCSIVPKTKFSDKVLNDLIISADNISETGKIILSNEKFLTIQKGQPYFFPNCKTENVLNKTELEYKTNSISRPFYQSKTNKKVRITYSDLTKLSINRPSNSKLSLIQKNVGKVEFLKLFIKKNGEFYSSLMPRILNFEMEVRNESDTEQLKIQKITLPREPDMSLVDYLNLNKGERSKDLLLKMQSSNRIGNKHKSSQAGNHQFIHVRFDRDLFKRSIKSVGIYSITKDYFEQELNTIFCKNNAFIEKGETLGLLNLEKEITDDIVQGLPRIEEILEARKKNLKLKRIPLSKKKGLLTQKTSLDPDFEFRKLGTTINENEKVNPHKLLKTYFNYYGVMKPFVCDRTKRIKFTRLIPNLEGTYKSFKKVQLFILQSVQSVYRSQGVDINDKHLEIIIRQMTTNVSITSEGKTPLLRNEVIDFYHIQYINQIVQNRGKRIAYYVPCLFGITKAALNNPSFISAASFQETTRVLTTAAIEGRIDWLRGLKENIIVGHLIPAGTGFPNYRNCFRKQLRTKQVSKHKKTIDN